MEDEIDLHSSGKMAWEMVEQECLFLPYVNPYKRFVLLFCFGLIAGAAAYLIWNLYAAAILILTSALCVPVLFYSVSLYLGEKKVGFLGAEISKEHIAIGCNNDRLVIPWQESSLEVTSMTELADEPRATRIMESVVLSITNQGSDLMMVS